MSVLACITWFYDSGKRSEEGRNMAAPTKKVFEVFVSKVPWTTAGSKSIKLFSHHSCVVAARHPSVATLFGTSFRAVGRHAITVTSARWANVSLCWKETAS